MRNVGKQFEKLADCEVLAGERGQMLAIAVKVVAKWTLGNWPARHDVFIGEIIFVIEFVCIRRIVIVRFVFVFIVRFVIVFGESASEQAESLSTIDFQGRPQSILAEGYFSPVLTDTGQQHWRCRFIQRCRRVRETVNENLGCDFDRDVEDRKNERV
ncbi:hypothetical protein C8R43DRAFT_1035402 [Mycena crocata]|nr:hypothetical protein C8R43DRAFT_1035402 [Mycena crocata]